LLQNEAVTLFVERAAAASGTFELTTSNQAAVVALCRRLDGLPLAIELAAVRTRVLSPEQILDRLTDRFGLLTGGSRAALPRHQTLRTTIEWSHDLLSPRERSLLRRLCVFVGRFTLEDVESVCTSDDLLSANVLNVLASLVDKSLVMKDEVKQLACYRLHETMREYAGLKLQEAGEKETVELRCGDYYLSRCQRSGAEARYRLLQWLEWMDIEIDNIRAVLRQYLIQEDYSRGIELAASVGWYWITRATTEGIRWLDQLLASEAVDPMVSARACFIRGFLAVLQADPWSARPALARAAEAARETQQFLLLSQALAMASVAANIAGDRTVARSLLDEAEAVAAGVTDVQARLAFLQAQALHGLFESDLATVRSASSEGVHLSRELGDLYTLEMMLMNLGSAAFIAGDLEESRPMLVEGLRIAHQIDDRVAQYALLDALACLAASSGQARLAAQLLGAAETVRAEAGARVIPTLPPLLAQAEKAAIAILGKSKFEAELNTGKTLSRDAAALLALGESRHPTAEVPEHAGVGLLGKREADVARLVAEGLSNKQIGARLLVSERTVDTHVRNILNKLGFNSRAQIAAWIAAS
jgi:DNA-binding NarL/FixJ family response regulator